LDVDVCVSHGNSRVVGQRLDMLMLLLRRGEVRIHLTITARRISQHHDRGETPEIERIGCTFDALPTVVF
jgi:hypothetical protein